jgi:hypothetical protein
MSAYTSGGGRTVSSDGLVPEIDRHIQTMRGGARPGTEPPPASSAPAAPVLPDRVEVTFSKPYMAHGEPVRRIMLRRPVTREIKQFGSPVRLKLDDEGRIDEIDCKWDVVASYIPVLSDPPLPPSTVDQLEFVDLDACAGALGPFFMTLR